MKKSSTLSRKLMVLGLCLLVPIAQLLAQCNVNDKYDKIISGYHSSIALKNDSTYSVWGAGMQNDGSSNQLSPQGINPTNYKALTGSIYKAAIGGTSGTGGDQAILLTSDGLWAWGGMGNVLNTSLTKSSTFARIKSPIGGIGSTSLGLPTGVSASDVQSMFATYQTLIILTKILTNVLRCCR